MTHILPISGHNKLEWERQHKGFHCEGQHKSFQCEGQQCMSEKENSRRRAWCWRAGIDITITFLVKERMGGRESLATHLNYTKRKLKLFDMQYRGITWDATWRIAAHYAHTPSGILNWDSPTRLPGNANPSSPDVSLASASLITSTNWQTKTNLGSDHLPILISLQMDVTITPIQHRTSINLKRAIDLGSKDNSLQAVELSGHQTCKLLSSHPFKPFPRRFSGSESVCSG